LARELKKQNFDASLILPLSFSSAFLFFLAEIPERIGYGAEWRHLFLTESIEYEKPRQRHLVWEYLRLVQKGFGSKLARKTFALEFSAKPGDAEASALIRKHKIADRKGLIALGPGATYGPAKRWPLPYWKELVQKLLGERQESLLILGGKEEKEYLQALVDDFAESREAKRIHLLAGETSVLGLASMLSRCKLLITNDTGPMHVAAAVKTPTVAVFGSTSPLWTRPFGLGHQVITHSVECSPCFQKTCPIGYICLNQITVGEVWKAVQKTLKAKTIVKAEPIPAGALA
jgi:heptosyltransferase-2